MQWLLVIHMYVYQISRGLFYTCMGHLCRRVVKNNYSLGGSVAGNQMNKILYNQQYV